MKKHKYVRFEYGFVILPEVFNHSDFQPFNVISAGFCYIDTKEQKCQCFGESISLKTKSLPEDSDAMTLQFFGWF